METIIIAALRFLLAQYNGFLKMIKIRGRNPFKSKNNGQLFDQYFIEAKVFYMKLFNVVPCVAYIGNVDTKKIFELIQGEKYGKVKEVYQRIYHDWEDDRICFSKTIFVIENKLMVKLEDDWLEVYFTTKDYAMANKMLKEFKTLKAPEKEKDYEINIISLSGQQLDLKTLAIKPTHLDLSLIHISEPTRQAEISYA